MKLIEVGDRIFTKNDYEFYATVAAVNRFTVEVEVRGETFKVDKSLFRHYSEDCETWDLPNWSIPFRECDY